MLTMKNRVYNNQTCSSDIQLFYLFVRKYKLFLVHHFPVTSRGTLSESGKETLHKYAKLFDVKSVGLV